MGAAGTGAGFGTGTGLVGNVREGVGILGWADKVDNELPEHGERAYDRGASWHIHWDALFVIDSILRTRRRKLDGLGCFQLGRGGGGRTYDVWYHVFNRRGDV